MKMLKRVLCVFVVMMFALLFEASVFAQQLRLGAECFEEYLSRLEGKKVGLVANQTSVVRNEKGKLVHLLLTPN